MKVMISAGEASGDIHAAKLVDALQKYTSEALPENPTLQCFGMGGSHLAARGVELLVDVENNTVMGLLEVLHKYPSLRAGLSTMRRALTEREPDILILVDYPHFNMKLAITARELGIPVLFFIAPKVWASRPGRVNELKKLVDHMALILPFEKKLFDDAAVPSTYVGNPLLDNKQLLAVSGTSADKKSTKSEYTKKRIALLPGSRNSEVSMLLPTMLKTCEVLATAQADPANEIANNNTQSTLEFILPVADTIKHEDIEEIIQQHNVDVKLIEPTDYSTLKKSDVALVASGTATLELAILGIPMVVTYKLNTISYQVLKRMLTTDYISLVNVIAGKQVVPEILQDAATAENLAREVSKLLTDDKARDKQITELANVYKQLGEEGASRRTAELAIALVRERSVDLAVS